MQLPTLQGTRIRNSKDAQKIFYAVEQGILHMVTKRLDVDERAALRSGNIYAWEERGPHSEVTGLGIERFTEGRRWSPSRVREDFLFYYEKYAPPPNHPGGPKAPKEWEGLVKQTYSVWVDLPKGRRKWHLTAYFGSGGVEGLRTVDDEDSLRTLRVPPDHFKSTRTTKPRNKAARRERRSSEDSVSPTNIRSMSGFSSSTADDTKGSIQMYDPYQPSHQPGNPYPNSSAPSASPSSLSSNGTLSPPTATTFGHHSSPQSQYVNSAAPSSEQNISHGHLHSRPSDQLQWGPASMSSNISPSNSSYPISPMAAWNMMNSGPGIAPGSSIPPVSTQSVHSKTGPHLFHLRTQGAPYMTGNIPASPSSDYHTSSPPSPSHSTHSSFTSYHPYAEKPPTPAPSRGLRGTQGPDRKLRLAPEEVLHRAQAVNSRPDVDAVYIEQFDRHGSETSQDWEERASSSYSHSG
ncbi:Gti1/Pac2 family-domain-containing protein [Flagelloscypha sp. PMI_526]|nr:Gti1/Pac2 family-domain-containing protein [Flagelloscypha sp. PMI_526]